MPTKTNPITLQPGAGQEPFTQANFNLLQTVPVPPPGDTAINPTTILIATAAQKHDAGVDQTFMLMSHVKDPHAAHPASAISVEDIPPGTFSSDNVQGVLQELAAGATPASGPANVGEWTGAFPLTTGIPDWGTLSLGTAAKGTFLLTSPIWPQSHIYPYQWVPPTPGNRTNLSQFGPFEPPLASTSLPPVPPVYFEFDQNSGADLTAEWNAGGAVPKDSVFNVAGAAPSPNYTGGGVGTALAGGFTRATTGDLVQTYRVMRSSANVTPVVVTGVVYPADRGVLALVHWPAGGLMVDFEAQSLVGPTGKVVAAICLGKGLFGEGTCPTDGEAGGLFVSGAAGDPYAWPGQASGQAGLDEIYLGVAKTFSTQTQADTNGANIFKVTSPYWNFDGRVSSALGITATAQTSPTIMQATLAAVHTFKIGQPITISAGNADLPAGTYTVQSIPAGNIVRLYAAGTGGGAAGGTAQRITGCDAADYPADGIPFPGQVRVGTIAGAGLPIVAGGVPILGAPWLQGAVRGTLAPTAPTVNADLNNNFFQYRLPVLADYSNAPTGLPYTPVLEKPRYYTKPPLSDDPSTDLTQAGNFTDYSQDYYPYQVARFRHRFEIPSAALFNDTGSYLLMHFKKEEYFEDLVVDGVWPSDDKIYSANVANVTAINAGTEGLEDVQASTAVNMIDQTPLSAPGWVNGSINGKPFFNLCGTVVVDRTDIVANPPAITPGPTFRIQTYPAALLTDWIHTVSGISYFAAKDDTNVRCFQIDRFVLSATGMFDDGAVRRAFLTGNPDGSFSTSRIMTMTPMMMHLGDFFGLRQGYTTTAPAGVWSHDQHVEFAIEAISAGTSVGGAGPAIGSAAVMPGITLETTGDATTPFMFSTNAKPHAFLRTPLSHSVSPTDGVNLGNSSLSLLGGDLVLFSGTTRDPTSGVGYGNLVNPLAPVPVPPLWPAAEPSTFLSQKMYEERFLDEVFRYQSDFGAILLVNNLRGPGLPLPPAPIEIPTKAGIATPFAGYNWNAASWFQSGSATDPCYEMTLGTFANGLPEELQVAGIPHRNPPISEGVYAPKPMAGMLLYPKEDYTTGYRPNLATDLVTQFDYTFGVFDRSYVRVIDLADVPVLPGTPFAILRFHGLTLEDFAYGGGVTPGSGNIAILVKVPGLTTWMDVGRVDGAGPSKQDPLLDGAGCKVLGPDTKNLTDIRFGYPIAQVKINVGPVANFFKCVVDPQCEDEIPLLVKVVYYCPHAVSQIQVRTNADVTGDTVTLDDGTNPSITLMEGVDWAAGGTAAVTATNIAAAINAAAPLGISAQSRSNIVYLMADVFGTSGTVSTVICAGAAPVGLAPTVLTNFTGGCESEKYDMSYAVTSAAGVTPVTFNPIPGEDFLSSSVRGLYTITPIPLP